MRVSVICSTALRGFAKTLPAASSAASGPLRLAGHRFQLVSGRHLYLVDENGADYRLEDGANLLGRHSDCDVVVDPGYRGVSRKHVIIEVLSPTTALMTDLSAHGTSIPEEALKSHG